MHTLETVVEMMYNGRYYDPYGRTHKKFDDLYPSEQKFWLQKAREYITRRRDD